MHAALQTAPLGCGAQMKNNLNCVSPSRLSCAAVSGSLWVLRAAFLMNFVSCTLPTWIIAAVTDLPLFQPRTVESWRRRGNLLARLSWLLWRLAFRLCFWIQIDEEGVAPLVEEAGRTHRQIVLCVNHVSYLDTPLVCTLCPWRLVTDLKVLMQRAYLRLPILGRLATDIGHIPIPFKSRHDGDFSVDRPEMARTSVKIDEHIAAGGHLIIFPEGQLNEEWQHLQQFRAGGFEIALRHDMEIWGLVIAGASDVWPAKAPLGGDPGRILCRAVLIAESATEVAAKLGGRSFCEQGRALASHVQGTMQRELDDMVLARFKAASQNSDDSASSASTPLTAPSQGGLRVRG